MLIPKNTQVRIAGTYEGQTKIDAVGFNQTGLILNFNYPFFKLVLADQPDTDSDSWIDDEIETVSTWDKQKRWKGIYPGLTGLGAFEEGYGPWFLCPEDLEVATMEDFKELEEN